MDADNDLRRTTLPIFWLEWKLPRLIKILESTSNLLLSKIKDTVSRYHHRDQSLSKTILSTCDEIHSGLGTWNGNTVKSFAPEILEIFFESIVQSISQNQWILIRVIFFLILNRVIVCLRLENFAHGMYIFYENKYLQWWEWNSFCSSLKL